MECGGIDAAFNVRATTKRTKLSGKELSTTKGKMFTKIVLIPDIFF
jgi:hypothetical protein